MHPGQFSAVGLKEKRGFCYYSKSENSSNQNSHSPNTPINQGGFTFALWTLTRKLLTDRFTWKTNKAMKNFSNVYFNNVVLEVRWRI